MSASTVDPRIRARRIAVRRDEGRQRLRRLLVLAGVLGVLAALAGAAFSPLLDVDAVRVTGAERTGEAAVRAAAAVRFGEAMVTVDADTVERAVEQLPWVAAASVKRSWPGTITVQVDERTASAAIADGQQRWLLIDAGGWALERVTGEPPPVPLVEGLDPDAAPGERVTGAADALELVATLPRSLGARVRRVTTGDDGLRLVVVLANGEEATALLGSREALRGKMLSLATVLDQVPPAGLERIDLRVPDAPVLTRS